MDRKALLLITVFVEGGLIALGLILLRYSQLELWSRFDLSWGATVSALLLCAPILAMLFFVVRSRWTPLFHLRSEIDEKIMPIFANSRLPDLALMAFLAGVGEELFFRGWLQRVLSDKFEPWFGIVIVSLIFGLAHYLSSAYAIYAGLIGLYLGVIYQISGNLYIVMAIHGIYDFIALVYFPKNLFLEGDKNAIIVMPFLLGGKEILMKEADRNALIAFPIVVLVGLGVAWAGSQGGATVFGIPLFAFAVGLAYLIQWLVFIPAFARQTEKFFDLTGGLTYITVTILAVILSPVRDARSLLLAVLVVIWAARLGTFLFRRIQKAGKDVRFDELKPSFFRFLNVWTIQGLWVTFTLAAALVAITTSIRKELGFFAIVGTLIWVFGFGFEVIADNQKSKFRANPANKGKFIQSGLWSKSRHPNYFGEIVLWIGVAVIALPVLRGWQWVALISPLFVTLLLTRVSGIPMLEKSADEKWGGQDDYENYKERTPVLIPRL